MSYIRSVSNVVSAVSPDSSISKTLRTFSDLLSSNPNGIPLDDLKSKVSEHLRETNQKIVVVIDDVDRLDPDEIRMMMKLVRSIADFSNIIYILCYDDEIVDPHQCDEVPFAGALFEDAPAIRGHYVVHLLIIRDPLGAYVRHRTVDAEVQPVQESVHLGDGGELVTEVDIGIYVSGR